MSLHCRSCNSPLTGIATQPCRRRLYCSRECYASGRIKDVATRFWSKVKKTDGCWTWTGSLNGNGYGQFAIKTGTPRLAHRVAWELERGPIPDGALVMHDCDNPRCINPDHLSLGTQSENMADSSFRGRISRGEHRPNSKLTEATVRQIRARHVAGEGHRKLAEEFGISRTTVSLVVNHRQWQHVE